MTHQDTGAVAPRPDAPDVDPYAPPAAKELEAAPAAPADRYYVVSAAKFWTLELVTAGLYGLVWMYKHWAAIKRASRGDEWPVMRAIFQVFFMHSLAAEIEQTLQRAGIRHAWAPAGLATGAVVGLLASALLDRVPAPMLSDNVSLGLSLVLVLVVAWFKWGIQRAANRACGDPEGRGNAAFSVANVAWVVGFGLFWLLVAAAVAMSLLVPPAV
jgi:hypothetical protein